MEAALTHSRVHEGPSAWWGALFKAHGVIGLECVTRAERARGSGRSRGLVGLKAISSCLVIAMGGGCGDESEGGVSFRNFRVDELTATSAVIRFDTSRPTTCEVEYGLDSDNLAFTATDPTMLDEQYAIEHRVPLFDLTPETTYYYRGMVVDPEGRVYRSELFVLTTPPGDGSSRPDSLALLSRGARVSAVSSNFGEGPNDGAWGANNAFDGKMGTEWASNGDGDDAFIEVYVFEFEGRYLAQRVRFEVDPSSGGNTGAREIELYSEGSE